MNKKLIYAGIIAAIFIVAMIVYRDSMTFSELIFAFVGASGTIIAVYQWLLKEDVKTIFKNEIGMSVNEFKRTKK